MAMTALPTIEHAGHIYFVDARLGEFRRTDRPWAPVPFADSSRFDSQPECAYCGTNLSVILEARLAGIQCDRGCCEDTPPSES
jgi:hypothetical protein